MKRNYYAYHGYRGRGRKRGNYNTHAAPDPNAPPSELLETPYGIIDLTDTNVVDLTGPSHAPPATASIPTGAMPMSNRPQVGIPPPPSYYQYPYTNMGATQAQPAAATQALPVQRPQTGNTGPPMATGSASTTQEDEVDLTDEPDEVYGDIYLGQINSNIVGIQYYTGVVSQHEQVILQREPQNRYDRNAVRVLNVRGEQVGHIPRVLAAHLAPVMDRFRTADFRVEGTIPQRPSGAFSIPIILRLYGSQQAVEPSTQLLTKAQRLSGHRVARPGEAAPSAAAHSSGKAPQAKAAAIQRCPTAQEILSRELEKLYQQPTPYEAMPEAQTPALLRSRLHQHQLKALYWMMKNERHVNVAQLLQEHEQEMRQQASAGSSANKKGPAQMANSTAFLYQLRRNPDGRPVYYNIATDSASLTPPILARGGILADDMGLGKSITALALIAADKEDEQRLRRFHASAANEPGLPPQPAFVPGRRPTLIVCPLSVIANWEEQIAEHVGIIEEDDVDPLAPPKGLKVLVYHGPDRSSVKLKDMVNYDVILTTYHIMAREGKANENKKVKKGLVGVPWKRVILDEGHTIRNRNASFAKGAFMLDAERRWVLSGTPIVNSLTDLFSLVKFLGVEPFNDFDWFNRTILRPIANQEMQGFENLQILVRFHCLRRTKTQKVRFVDGSLRPLISLPPKTLSVVPVEMNTADREAYDALFFFARHLVTTMSEAMDLQKHVLGLLTRLRLLCDHRALVPSELLDKVIAMAARMPTGGKGEGQAGPLDAKACMDKAMKELGLEGLQNLLKMFLQRTKEGEECSICLNAGADVITRCGHIYHRDCIREFVLHKVGSAAPTSATAPCPNCRQPVSLNDLMEGNSSALPTDLEGAKQEKEEDAKPAAVGATGPARSAKLEAIVTHVKDIVGRSADDGNKVLVFSQFTSFLDLLGPALDEEGVAFVRFDGSSSREKRARAIDAFQKDPDVRVFLLSLKAGGTGLNLTAASSVVLCDPWYNPATEDQAIDRVHRMGQVRPVQVTRFITAKSIEESLLRLQTSKRQLAQASFHTSRDELRSMNLQMLSSVFDL